MEVEQEIVFRRYSFQAVVLVPTEGPLTQGILPAYFVVFCVIGNN